MKNLLIKPVPVFLRCLREYYVSNHQPSMSVCIDEVAMWMRANRLKLNTAKTDVFWCSSSRRQEQIPQAALKA